MTGKDDQEKRVAEIRRLFAELSETYARATALIETGDATQGQIGEERRKASAIIAKIRETQKI